MTLAELMRDGRQTEPLCKNCQYWEQFEYAEGNPGRVKFGYCSHSLIDEKVSVEDGRGELVTAFDFGCVYFEQRPLP